MQVGVVKWYDSRMGYGFILTDSGEDVLAHYTVIQGTGFRRLFDGEKVEYEATRGPKGLNATAVRRLNPERPSKTEPQDGQPKAKKRKPKNNKKSDPSISRGSPVSDAPPGAASGPSVDSPQPDK